MDPYIRTGAMPWMPNYAITAEGDDITEAIRNGLINITLTDFGGSEKKSDQMSFAVVSANLKIPSKGVKLSLWLGFGEELVDKGTFVVDSATSGASSNSPRIVEITGRAFSKSNGRGHTTLQSQKTRSFSDVKLGDLVSKLAIEHGLTARIPESLANIPVSHIDQIAESNMNLMTRLAERYGAVSKITHDYWILTEREGEKSVSGQELKTLLITAEMLGASGGVGRWSYRDNSNTPDSSSEGGGTHVISYTDVTDGAKTKTLTVGSGEPVMHYSVPFPDFASAKRVAAGLTTSSKKKLKTMSIDMLATPELMGLTAQCRIETAGFGTAEDRKWSISKLSMSLGSQGFTISMDLE